MSRLLIIGAGGHGKVVADVAEQMGSWSTIEFTDARFPELSTCEHWPVVAKHPSELSEEYLGSDFIVAIGNNSQRLKNYYEIKCQGFKPVTVIHPSAVVSEYSRIGKGVVIFAGVVINVATVVEDACIINTGATVDHDCTLKRGAHISPGAHLGGEVEVGERSWVGIGAIVKQVITIGSDVIVGAGAVVVSDVQPEITVVGVPAKPV
tara:strand:- start:4129 stop:4749 length:621 start_codon:yes stop_codon:yes gene_type:complete